MAPEKGHTSPSSLDRVYPPTLAFRKLLASKNLLSGWVVPCLCLHRLLHQPHNVWLKWGIQELGFEGSLGFSFYPARQPVVEQGASADEEFLLSLEPLAAVAPPQSSTGHIYQLCLTATGTWTQEQQGPAGGSWKKIWMPTETTKLSRCCFLAPLVMPPKKKRVCLWHPTGGGRSREQHSKCFQ